jgi:ABC-2 type transport system permease protein
MRTEWLYRIRLVIWKDWLEIRQQKGLLLGMLFLPVLFTGLPLGIMVAVRFTPPDEDIGPLVEALKQTGAVAGMNELELTQFAVSQPVSIMLLLLPVILSSIIASYSIVGEKLNQTLEPVLATPVATWELLTGKTLSSLFPALAITWVFTALFVVGTAFVAVSPRVFAGIISPAWVLLVVLCAPLLAVCAIAATVAISSRVNDPRSAQQISAVFVLPVVLLMGGQFTGLLVLNPFVALIVAGGLAVLAAITMWIATLVFGREAILTRWG